ncbi:MAG: electron transfer flavoprotein subunit alpha/FixB family protein [bacterium]|jgi:electron transfer flavoprotein alpha subunit
MSILIFAEHSDGVIKKGSLEAISYGASLATQTGAEAYALVLGKTSAPLNELGAYGAKKVFHVSPDEHFPSDTKSIAQIISTVMEQQQSEVLIFANTLTAKGVAPRVSVKIKAGLVTGAVALPQLDNGFVVKKNVFSGKAFSDVKILTSKKIITLNQNAFEIINTGGPAEVVALKMDMPASNVSVVQVNKTAGEIPLAEAERVISGGRGLKGPENWGMVEELAKITGAATACSRAVADAHWRPHHEHVGQTGLAIAPNLYFAIGISGAIQHLAGVNRSKTIVVINKDPEAPFFKSADYGIVGDAFEVMPKIIQAVKDLGK